MRKKLLSLVCYTLACFTISANEAYPDFSWDRVPVCLHFSNGTDDFTPDEINFIAKHPVICIEKNQAIKKHGSMEYGTLAAAKAIKSVNPRTKVLFYFNSYIDFGSMYEHGRILSDNKHPEWAIKNIKGDYVITRNNKSLRTYDLSQKQVRDWWLGIVNKWTSLDELDGVFIDALPKYVAGAAGKKKNWGEDKYNQVYDGLHTMLDDLMAGYDGKKLVIANYLRGNEKAMPGMGVQFLNHTDGGMIEHFGSLSGRSKEHIAKDIELIQKAAKMNKMVVVKAWPSFNFVGMKDFKNATQQAKEEQARKDITFPLACFLCGAGEYSYFCYSWGYRNNDGGTVDYEEYNKPLGKPLGDAKKKGWVYTRAFQHAEVWVDLEKREAKINWNK